MPVTAHGLDVAPLQWPEGVSPEPRIFRRCVIFCKNCKLICCVKLFEGARGVPGAIAGLGHFTPIGKGGCSRAHELACRSC